MMHTIVKMTAVCLNFLALGAWADSVTLYGRPVDVTVSHNGSGTLNADTDVTINGDVFPLKAKTALEWNAQRGTLMRATLRAPVNFATPDGTVVLAAESEARWDREGNLTSATVANSILVKREGFALNTISNATYYLEGHKGLTSMPVGPGTVRWGGYTFEIPKSGMVYFNGGTLYACEAYQDGPLKTTLFGRTLQVKSATYDRFNSRPVLQRVTLWNHEIINIGGTTARVGGFECDQTGAIDRAVLSEAASVMIDGKKSELAAGARLFIAADLTRFSMTKEGLGAAVQPPPGAAVAQPLPPPPAAALDAAGVARPLPPPPPGTVVAPAAVMQPRPPPPPAVLAPVAQPVAAPVKGAVPLSPLPGAKKRRR